MAARAIAMASGIMPEATPAQMVEAAARAGFDYGGIWIEPSAWTSAATRAVKAQLVATGLSLLDVEVVWLKAGPPDPEHMRIVDIGSELGARNVLCVSSDPDPSSARDKLGALIELGAANGIRINLEFGLFTEVKTIHQAQALLASVDGPAAGLLIDALHWSRSAGTVDDIAGVPARWLSYAQLCDAPGPGADPADADAILAEAIDGRTPLGQGSLKLDALIAALPATLPFAIEERSKRLRDRHPDFIDRARTVLRTSREFLDRLG